MTVSVTTDHALIRKTVREWLLNYAGPGLTDVDYVNQEAPRLAKPYGTLFVISSGVRVGSTDEIRQSFDETNEVIQRLTTGPRRIVVQCEVYTDPAGNPSTLEAAERLENALLALDTIAVRNVFRAAKIAVEGHTAVTRLDEQSGDRWERRALADVTLTYSGETFDDGLTGEDGNWVETIQIPTEDNGNLRVGGAAIGGEGFEWTPQASGTGENLWGVGGIGDSVRVAAANNDVVQRTENGGATWAAVSPPVAGDWQNVRCRDGGVCLMVGLLGAAANLRRSTDSGATWATVDSGSPDDLYGVLYEPSTDAWLVCSLYLSGLGPKLRRSVDDGLVWSEATHSFDNDLLAMAADGAGRVVIVGQGGLNGYSSDGGQNWTQNADLGSVIYDVAFDLASGNFVHGSTLSTIRYSEDGGVTWKPANVTTIYNGRIRSVYANDIGVIIAVGQNKSILRSTDGGKNWDVVNETQLDDELLAVFHAGKTWHTSGRNGTILTAP